MSNWTQAYSNPSRTCAKIGLMKRLTSTRAVRPAAPKEPSKRASTKPRAGRAKAKTADAVELPQDRFTSMAVDTNHMLEEHTSAADSRPVNFRFFSREAREVYLAGTFNDWRPTATPLTRQPDGTWMTEMFLNPGAYEYRFVVDGRWTNDPMSGRDVPNPFGSTNSLIEI